MNTRKRIGIDARLIAQTGVGRYIHELVREIAILADKHTTADLFIYIRKEDEHLAPAQTSHIHIRHCPHQWHSWSEQWGFYLQIMKDKLDLMHFTYFSFPLLYRRPYVITLHDLTPLIHATGSASTKHPLIYGFKKWAYEILIRVASRQSKAIITPTHTIKRDVMHHLHAPSHKIHVTYEAISTSLLNTQPLSSSPLKHPYFLYVGNMYPHKNIELLLQALTRIPEKYHCVIIGARDHFTQHMQERVQTLALKDRVTFTGKVSDQELATYYAHARALVHPSLAEGFGLTPLEALYFGTPVIASDLEIFKETLGTSYTPIDPRSVDSLVEGMMKHAENAIRPSMTPDDIKKAYSFHTMAQSTWTLYMDILRA